MPSIDYRKVIDLGADTLISLEEYFRHQNDGPQIHAIKMMAPKFAPSR